MRKLTTVLVVAGLFLFVACDPGNGVVDQGGAGDDVASGDDVTVLDVLVGVDSAVADDTVVAADSIVAVDSVVFPDVSGEDSAVGQDTFENTGLYAIEPDVGQCVPGAASDYQKQIVLDRVNHIRSLHGLYPVDYNADGDEQTAACALIIAANRELSHTPGTGWDCWTQDAYDGCNSSNIYIQWGRPAEDFSSETVVDSFMTDEGVDTLGHRRWLIDPWLAHISFGRVDGDKFDSNTTGAAIKVINGDAQQDIRSSGLEFVAYPFEDYPAELYNSDVMMSLTVIADTASKYNCQFVDFSSADVSVTGPGGAALTVSGVVGDNQWYAVPNNLRWFAQGVKADVTYDVNVTNVDVDGVTRTYSWWFELN